MTSRTRYSQDQYMIYAHQTGVSGTVTLTGEKKYTWLTEPGYAATVKSEDGEAVVSFRQRCVAVFFRGAA